jgi:hypothetical protein
METNSALINGVVDAIDATQVRMDRYAPDNIIEFIYARFVCGNISNKCFYIGEQNCCHQVRVYIAQDYINFGVARIYDTTIR